MNFLDGAKAHAGIGFEGELVARGGIAFFGHPRGYAACAVAADLGDGAIGIVQADAAGGVAGPRKELDAVGADACVPFAKALGEDRFVHAADIVFIDDQKIIAACVCLDEGNQSSSGSRKVRTTSMAGSASNCPRRRSCCFLVVVTEKLTRWISPMLSRSGGGRRSPALSMASRMDWSMAFSSCPRASYMSG